MKIIFVTREGYRLPGARIRCYNFARELKKYGIETEVFSYPDNLGAQDGENESKMALADKIRFNYRALKELLRDKEAILYIQRFNYHSLAPYLAHLFKKNRIILDLDDWEMREDPKYYFKLYPSSKAHFFTRQIAKISVFCVAASRFLERFLLEFNSRTYYIPSGVDTEMFRPFGDTLNGGIQNKKEILLSWIGAFHKKEYVENIKFALGCFHELRKEYHCLYFDIVGDGIYRDLVNESARLVGDTHIRLRGWLNPEAIPDYLSGVDIGLLPIAADTKFNRAKSPTKLFEYMSMAKPTVSSSIGEAREIIRDGQNGFLAADREGFIRKVQELIEDAQLRRRIGRKARESAENDYSLRISGRRLAGILRTI